MTDTKVSLQNKSIITEFVCEMQTDSTLSLSIALARELELKTRI